MIETGWERWKLAHAYRRIGSGTTPTSGNADYYDDETGTPWITTSELRESYIERTSTNVTQAALDDFTTLRIYAPNSVFMAMYGATIGRLGISTIPATCNQACCVFESSDRFDNRFLFYWLWHRRAELISLSVGGGQPNLSQQDLKSEIALCPPLETQKRIAAFLDEKTARIDALIAKKQALLERLAEKRQAIITQAVTKGFNPAAPMKESGIDWLGQIPAHWEVKRLKNIVSRPLRYGANAPADWDEPTWPRFVRITDVDPDGKLRPETFRSLPPEIGNPFRLDSGDILLARSGATVGKSFIYRPEWGDACFAGYLIQARIGSDQDPDFIYQFLNSDAFWSWVSANFIQSTIQNISAEKYANLWICCPPLAEQREIVAATTVRLMRIDGQAHLVGQSLKKLAEYRAALIIAAVTGQIEGLQ